MGIAFVREARREATHGTLEREQRCLIGIDPIPATLRVRVHS
jgi:hypothetical protein